MASRRRGCGKVGIPPAFAGFPSGVGNSVFGFPRSVFSTALCAALFSVGSQGLPVRLCSDRPVGSIAEAQRCIEMLMHRYRAAGQRPAPAHRLDLQGEILKAHRVVAIHGPFELQGKHLLQIPLPAGQ